MTAEEILELVAVSLRQSASPSVNGIHVPDRYQASVTAEDMANRLLRAGLVKDKDARNAFYDRAMPAKDSGDTWNSLANVGFPTGAPPPSAAPILHERIARLLADAEQLAIDLRDARNAAPAGEKGPYRYPCRHIEHAVALIRKAGK